MRAALLTAVGYGWLADHNSSILFIYGRARYYGNDVCREASAGGPGATSRSNYHAVNNINNDLRPQGGYCEDNSLQECELGRQSYNLCYIAEVE